MSINIKLDMESDMAVSRNLGPFQKAVTCTAPMSLQYGPYGLY